MKSKKSFRGSSSQYGLAFRNEVSRDYLSSDLSYLQIIEKYDLPHINMVKWWVRCYKKNSDLPVVSLPPMTSEEKEEKKALEKRIKALEKQLADAQLKGLALDTMIDVAEEMFDIEIRKKPGTKQSNA